MTRPELVAPPAVERIASRLIDAGFDTWAVGGALRNAILGDDVVDWDFATQARPEEVLKLFPRTVPVGIAHGTVGVLDGGHLYEVTTFRRDVDTDGRHAVVAYSDTIEEDLSRRDFTINAIAWHPVEDRWLDPFGGTQDLSDRILRTVGSPADRFREDRLRVLRGLRFAGRLGFEVEADTWVAMCDSAPFLDTLSAERVREELMKVLACARPSVALALYREAGALGALFPELTPDSGVSAERFAAALRVVDAVRKSHPVSRLTALLQPVVESHGNGITTLLQLLKRLRCSNAEQRNVSGWLVGLGSGPPTGGASEQRLWLSKVGRENLRGIASIWAGFARLQADPKSIAEVAEAIRALRVIARSGVPLTVGELAIGGNDLRGAGLTPGPIFSRILDQLLERVLADPGLNRPDELLALVPMLSARSDEASDE